MTISPPSRVRRLARRAPRGFTLVEIAVVLLVLSLLLGIIATFSGGLVAQQRREVTRQRLQGVETALALFVAQNKRLPCPADGALSSTNALAGVESPNPPTSNTCGANSQARGVVPWRALGLAEQDITDGWGNRFTYRVATDFVQTGSMNFTRCDPAGTGNAVSLDNVNGYCFNPAASSSFTPSEWTEPQKVTADKGLRVRNLAVALIMDPDPSLTSPVPNTGAAYVVVSHGENSVGGYNNQGVLQTTGSIAAGTQEQRNFANLQYVSGCAAGSTTCTGYLVDDFPAFAQGTGYFDDMVLRPSILAVALRAQTGPRAH